MAYQYLMVFQNGQAAVFCLRNGKRGLDCLTNKGEERFPIREDFWEWWKEAVSYLEGETVDFCFLYDREYEVLNTEWKMADPSVWNEGLVETYFSEKTDYSDIILIGKDRIEKGRIGRDRNEQGGIGRDWNEQGRIGRRLKQKKGFADASPTTFYTNLSLGRPDKAEGTEEKREGTVFARYWKEYVAEAEPSDNRTGR